MKAGRIAALRVLLDTLRGGGAYGLSERLGALPRLLTQMVRGAYSGWDRGRGAAIVLGVVYVVSPIDLVPEILLGPLGLADDALVAAWLAGTFLHEIDRFLDWERARDRVVPGRMV